MGNAIRHGGRSIHISAHRLEHLDSLGLGLRVAWLLAHRMGGRIEYRRSGSLTMFDFILRAVETPIPSDLTAWRHERQAAD